MKSEDVLKLVDAGFSKDEILSILSNGEGSPVVDKVDKVQEVTVTDQEGEQLNPAPEEEKKTSVSSDPLKEELANLRKEIQELNKGAISVPATTEAEDSVDIMAKVFGLEKYK